MAQKDDRKTKYQEGSLTLAGTVMLGTGVMIGAGIFALTGQMAQMTGVLFPLAYLPAHRLSGLDGNPDPVSRHQSRFPLFHSFCGLVSR